jgi:Tol biopolymer transport system component
MEHYGRSFDTELWLLKGDLSGPPIAFGQPHTEGIAVSRAGMRIAWAKPMGAKPPRIPDVQRRQHGEGSGGSGNKIWTADIVYVDGAPRLANERVILDCADTASPLVRLVTRAGQRCAGFEPQNFVPTDDNRLTFTMATLGPQAGAGYSVGAYVINLRSGEVVDVDQNVGYAEAEGVFPDGKSTLVEYAESPDLAKATHMVDLWRYPLDGSGRKTPVTRYNAIDSSLKSNQGTISPDGRWLAFGVSTTQIEAKVAGQGLGVFLMDMKAAGF